MAGTLPVIIQTVCVLSTRSQMARRVKGLRDHHTAMLVVWAIVIRSFQDKAGQQLPTIWLASLHLIAAGSRPRGRAKKRHSNKRMKGTEADYFRSGKESDCFFKGVKLEQGENLQTPSFNNILVTSGSLVITQFSWTKGLCLLLLCYFGYTVKSFTFLALSFKGKENLQMSLNTSYYDILAFPLIIIKRKCILHGSRITKISILKFHQPPMESVFSK